MNLIFIINQSAFQSRLLSFVILFLISTIGLASPSFENIEDLLNRSKSNTLQDCHYFNELYKQCESANEVYKYSDKLNSDLHEPQNQKRNIIATARRLSALGQHKQALKVLDRLHSNSNQLLIPSIQSEHFHTLGFIAMNSGNPVISLDYYKKAAKTSAKSTNLVLYQSHLCAIGVALNANGSYNEALEYFEKAKQLETQGENRNTLYLKLNIALTEMNLGKLSVAKQKFFEAIPLIDAKNDAYAKIRTLGNLGEIYEKQDSLKLAKEYFLKAQFLAFSNNQSLDLIRINSALSSIYEKQGDTEEALKLLKSVIKIDSDLNEGVSESLSAEEFKNEIQGQKKINAKIKEQRDREIKLKKYLLFAVVVLVLLLIALITYMVLFRKKKQFLLKKELSIKKSSNQESQKQYSDIILNLEKIILEEELYKQSGLTLDSLAKRIGTNRSYLSEAINAHYQQTFLSWLNGLRIETAKSLLTDPKNKHLSIEGIAKTAGFASISTFNSHFKKETGLTPSYFRNKSRN